MQTAHSRIVERAPPFLYIGAVERAAIAQLREAAAAAPLRLAETAALLARRRRGEDLGDAAAWTVALRFGFFASYRIEDWPDGRWRRLSIRVPASGQGGRWPHPGIAAVLLGEFGFAATTLGENTVWRGKAGKGAVLHIAERIGPLPDGDDCATAAPAPTGADEPLPPVNDDGDEADGYS